jgi:thiamine biosynthesis lipoprotein
MIPPQPQAGILSDVASKPIFIAQGQARINAAKAMQVTHFLVIESEKNIIASADMEKQLQWLDTDAEKQLKVIQLD